MTAAYLPTILFTLGLNAGPVAVQLPTRVITFQGAVPGDVVFVGALQTSVVFTGTMPGDVVFTGVISGQ